MDTWLKSVSKKELIPLPNLSAGKSTIKSWVESAYKSPSERAQNNSMSFNERWVSFAV